MAVAVAAWGITSALVLTSGGSAEPINLNPVDHLMPYIKANAEPQRPVSKQNSILIALAVIILALVILPATQNQESIPEMLISYPGDVLGQCNPRGSVLYTEATPQLQPIIVAAGSIINSVMVSIDTASGDPTACTHRYYQQFKHNKE
jgi:hypothetical protein